MPKSVKPVPYLRDRVDKVEDLWHQEDEERLAEVPENPGHCDGHAGKVGERVSNEDP